MTRLAFQKSIVPPSCELSSTFYLMACSMTWNGAQGFHTPIANDYFIVDGAGALGTTYTERGLTYFEVKLSGDMVSVFTLGLAAVSYVILGHSVNNLDAKISIPIDVIDPEAWVGSGLQL